MGYEGRKKRKVRYTHKKEKEKVDRKKEKGGKYEEAMCVGRKEMAAPFLNAYFCQISTCRLDIQHTSLFVIQ